MPFRPITNSPFRLITGGPAPVAPFTARFGIGAQNASGTGAFNTALYTATAPADGTYGPFTVASGVITPNGTQTVGTYDVGGYPVEVLSGYKICANQTEWNALVWTDRGQIIMPREAALIFWDATVSGTFGYRTNGYDTIILGDGPRVCADPWDTSLDARAHFIGTKFRAMNNFTFKNLRICTNLAATGMSFIETSGGGVSSYNVNIEENLVVVGRPDPNGDFSAGYTSWSGIHFNAPYAGVTIKNNVVIGANIGIRGYSTNYLEMIGNQVWLCWEDANKITNTNCPTIFGGNIAGMAIGKPTDAGSPHCDGEQILPGATNPNIVIEACAYFEGDSRGRGVVQPFFNSDSTPGYQTVLRDCVVVADNSYPYTIDKLQGSTIEYVAWAPSQLSAIPASVYGEIRFGSVSATGINYLQYSICVAGGSVHASVTKTGNISPSGYTSSDWLALYEDWTVGGRSYPTLFETMAALKTKAGGPGDGIGHRVSFDSDLPSSYQIAGIAAPTLSSLTVTVTTAASAAATIVTDTDLNPIFWAVVPKDTTIANPRDIKRRRVTGALIYGFANLKNGDAVAGSIALNLAGALVATTQYDVVCEQENGWTKVSAISRATFTAT